MSVELLKVVAMCTMLLDHLGAIGFFGEASMAMRYVGRVSFPIYAYLMASGFCFSQNKLKHISFLGIFALISEIPFDLIYGGMYVPEYQNVIWTFFFASIAMYGIDRAENVFSGFFALFLGAGCYFAVYVLNADYSVYGFSLVLCMYVFENALCLGKCRDDICKKRGTPSLWFREQEYVQVCLILLVNLTTILYFVNSSMTSLPVTLFGITFSAQLFGMFAMIPISFYIFTGQKKVLTGNPGKIFKWFHYWFYPGHLLLLNFL